MTATASTGTRDSIVVATGKCSLARIQYIIMIHSALALVR